MEREDARELRFPEEFVNAKCLSLSEVSHLLDQTVQSRLQNKLPPPQSDVFQQVQEYVSRFGKGKHSKEYIHGIRKNLDKHNLYEFEIASLLNLVPSSLDEAVTLIPSLKRLDEQTIQTIIDYIGLLITAQDDEED